MTYPENQVITSVSKLIRDGSFNSWTCEDFLAVDESFQPTAVGYAEALNNKDKPEDAVLDVQGIATATPAIIQACSQDKKANFKDKVKGEWDKIKKDM